MKKTFKQMQSSVTKKIILIFCLLSLPVSCFAQSLAGVTSSVHNPAQLSKWLSNNFRYELEFPDHWQPAQETLDLKKGDCEDFAILAQNILKELGIESFIVIVNLKDFKQSHAICVFKDDKYYSFFSNQILVQTGAASIEGAVQEGYPDWASIIFTNSKKQSVKIVSRKK
mgnify:CR=1 FL=1